MKFSSARDASDRAGGGVTRHTLVKADDTHFMQEVEIQGFAGEQAQTIEHAHPYGFASVANDQVQGAVQAAEGFVAHLSGNRSHGVVLVMGDRRYRVMNLGKGDVCFHRDDGQQIHFTSTGMVVSAPNDKSITLQIMQSSTMPPASPQPQGASAQMGQAAQAGKPTVATVVLNANGLTVNHPGAVTVNSATANVNATSTITHTAAQAIEHVSQNSNVTLSAVNGAISHVAKTINLNGSNGLSLNLPTVAGATGTLWNNLGAVSVA